MSGLELSSGVWLSGANERSRSVTARLRVDASPTVGDFQFVFSRLNGWFSIV